MDYSRFNYLDHNLDEDKLKLAKPAPTAKPHEEKEEEEMSEMQDILRQMPPELREAYRLMAIARESGDVEAQKRANELAMKAVENGGPRVKEAFIKNLSAQAPEIAKRLGTEVGEVSTDATLSTEEIVNSLLKPKAKSFDSTVDELRKKMEAGQAASRRQLEDLQKQQDQLERLKSPEDIMAFVQQSGMAHEDLQRIFGGDQNHMEDCLRKIVDTAAEGSTLGGGVEGAEEAVKAAEALHGAICGNQASETAIAIATGAPPAEQARAKPAGRKPEGPPPRAVNIPVYRLQYQKDEDGRYLAVELRATLPGVADMSAILLDVSKEHLRLTTCEPAPGYAVNAGPFPVPIDASAAKAKYSRKREEIHIVVPALR